MGSDVGIRSDDFDNADTIVGSTTNNECKRRAKYIIDVTNNG